MCVCCIGLCVSILTQCVRVFGVCVWCIRQGLVLFHILSVQVYYTHDFPCTHVHCTCMCTEQGTVPFDVSRLFKWQTTNTLASVEDTTDGTSFLMHSTILLQATIILSSVLASFIFDPHITQHNLTLSRSSSDPSLFPASSGQQVCQSRAPLISLLPLPGPALLCLRQLHGRQTFGSLQPHQEVGTVTLYVVTLSAAANTALCNNSVCVCTSNG